MHEHTKQGFFICFFNVEYRYIKGIFQVTQCDSIKEEVAWRWIAIIGLSPIKWAYKCSAPILNAGKTKIRLQESFCFFIFEPTAAQSRSPFEKWCSVNNREDPMNMDLVHLNLSTKVNRFLRLNRGHSLALLWLINSTTIWIEGKAPYLSAGSILIVGEFNNCSLLVSHSSRILVSRKNKK